MKKKWNLDKLILIEKIIIFCLILMFSSIIFGTIIFGTIKSHKQFNNIFSFSILMIIIICISNLFIFIVIPDWFHNFILYQNPNSIFNFGKWQYVETKQKGIFELNYISTSWKQNAIDLTDTKKTVVEICEFIEENKEDIQFNGQLHVKESNFYIENFPISTTEIIEKIKENKKCVKFETLVNLIFIRNTLKDNICINFIKFEEIKKPLIEYVKKLNLSEILKCFLSFKEEILDAAQLDFFDYVDCECINDNIIYLHKNKWKDFDDIK